MNLLPVEEATKAKLALCYCFTLINEHDVNTYDTMMLS
jgi:hypothetical protein